jgi:anaerobic dimethyl sulfoxide reductase subunit B (iron-sulfur subunit)
VTVAKKGLVIHYVYCTSCMACVVACEQEHGYPVGRWGIMVKDLSRETEGKVQADFLPFPTDLCDLYARRIAAGEKPACAKHCMAACMRYGEISELTRVMETMPKSALFEPR